MQDFKLASYTHMAFNGQNIQYCNEFDPLFGSFLRRLEITLESAIWEGCTYFSFDGVSGVELHAIETLLMLRKRYPWIHIEVIMPVHTQFVQIPPVLRQRTENVLANVNTITRIGYDHSHFAVAAREHYQLSHADVVLAICEGGRHLENQLAQAARNAGIPLTCLPMNNATQFRQLPVYTTIPTPYARMMPISA